MRVYGVHPGVFTGGWVCYKRALVIAEQMWILMHSNSQQA